MALELLVETLRAKHARQQYGVVVVSLLHLGSSSRVDKVEGIEATTCKHGLGARQGAERCSINFRQP